MELMYRDYLETELTLVESHLEAARKVDGSLMGEVAQYVLSRSGKLLRPVMVCLSAKAFGYKDPHQHHARLGAALELFHVATLLHDDVIDKASLRRGRQTVSDKWGDDVAILMADYLYATSFDFALEVLNPQIVQILSKTTQKMTEGEMFQIQKRGQWLSMDDYFNIIESKTAYLFSAAAGLGAILANASHGDTQKMFRYGLKFGLAFQITDDALDYEAREDELGKPVGGDLKEGKQTLPLLHTLAHASEADRAQLVHTLNNGRDFNLVQGLVHKYNGIDAALEKASEFTREAIEVLDSLENTEPVMHLRQITEGVLARSH